MLGRFYSASAAGSASVALVCLYAGQPDVVSPLQPLHGCPQSRRLRQEIDAIDGDLHGLIRRRAALVGEITAAKPPGGLALRPGREAQVMRQRLATHEGAFPAAAVYRMWREMMSAFTLMQTPALKVAVCRPADQPGYWDLARDHFGCQIPFVGNDIAGPGAGRGARQPDDHRRRAGADRSRHRAVVAAAGRRRRRRCPTWWRGCPSWSCPMPARAASRPSCWRASSPRTAATIAP